MNREEQNEYIKGLPTSEILKRVKEYSREHLKCIKEIGRLRREIRRLSKERYKYYGVMYDMKVEVGMRKGKGCPTLDYLRGDCKAKLYKHPCYGLSDLYRKRCFHCHLTHQEAKTAMAMNKILGRR